jgi:hypothetical protein
MKSEKRFNQKSSDNFLAIVDRHFVQEPHMTYTVKTNFNYTVYQDGIKIYFGHQNGKYYI